MFPKNVVFQVVAEHSAGNLVIDSDYLGIKTQRGCHCNPGDFKMKDEQWS